MFVDVVQLGLPIAKDALFPLHSGMSASNVEIAAVNAHAGLTSIQSWRPEKVELG
jgi:hypothetical protein